MNENNKAENGKYKLEIWLGENSYNPRDDSTFGTMVCFASRYNLGDEHNYSDKDDFFEDLLVNMFKDEDTASKIACAIREREYTLDKEDNELLLSIISTKYLVLPLYFYNHSVQSISTKSFVGRAVHAEWDSGLVGWVYVSYDDIIKEYGDISETSLAKARDLLDAEVEYYDLYLRGECYGFTLTETETDEVECIGGFLGNYNDMLEEMKGYVEEDSHSLFDELKIRK